MSVSDRATVRDLRRLRRRRRLGDIEWFDVAYRVYLFALVGLIAVVTLSDAIAGVIGEDVTTADVLARGPATLGLLAMLAVAIGLRSGAEGGPISIEAADVRHLLSAPVSRRLVLLQPITQRIRAVAFGLALGGGVIGQLVARELEGSRAAWAASGALFGAAVGVCYAATAVVAHALRLPRWAATALGAAGLAWQGLAAWHVWSGDGPDVHGPADVVGSLALWGVRQRAVDVVGLLAVAALLAAALLLGGRLRVEPLVRRGELVSQLRFAATVQDLRTVVLLRRQLRSEHLRTRPWGARAPRPVAHPTAPAGGGTRPGPQSRPGRARRAAPTVGASDARLVHRRGLASLRRLPAPRLGRIGALAALAGVMASLTVTASPLFVTAMVIALFLLGLEVVEPLSQEIDRPDLTDSVPVDRGWLYVHHLVAPGGLLVLAALVGAATAIAVDPGHSAAALGLSVPVVVAGAIGAVVATVRDAPEPPAVAGTTVTGASRHADNPLVPPEFAGFGNAFGSFMPVLVSGLSALPVLAMRVEPTAGTVVRSAVGVAVALVVVVWWIRRRDRWAVRLRAFFAEARAASS